MREIPRERASIAALLLLMMACSLGIIVFKPGAIVFCLLGLLLGLAALVLAAPSRSTVNRLNAWAIIGVVATLVAIAGGFIIGVMGR